MFDLETAQFQKALKLYADASKHDNAYICNRTALNLAIKTAQQTPIADPAKIQSLTSRPWWPKYISKKFRRGATFGKGSKRRTVQGKFTRAEARQVSKATIQGRLRRRGYIRAGWLGAIKILNKLKDVAKGLRANVPGTAQFTSQPGTAFPAQPGVYASCEIINQADGAATVGEEALRRGLVEAAQDMTKFALERMGQTAEEHSAK